MDWFWSFIWYGLPWWAQVSLLAALIGLPAYLIARAVLGAERANRLLLPILGALAVIGLGSKIRQGGYKDRVVEEERVEDQVQDEFTQIHRRNEALPDTELDKKNDPWIKP